MTVVDVLDASRMAKLGLSQSGFQPAAVALGELAVDHQPEALFGGERVGVVHAQLLFERLGHAAEPQGVEFLKRRMGQHARVSGVSVR